MADENKTPKMARPGLGEQQDRKKLGPKGGLGNLAGKKKKTLKDLEPIIIDLDLSRPGNERKIKIKKIESKAKGGRAGYKHGGAAKRGHGCEIK